ncbi:hypothetical protein TNCV_5023811 [Trichonephila clavipes]|nr:hypothetical protein TNCV_5023811 [Trichonephila clavipes]
MATSSFMSHNYSSSQRQREFRRHFNIPLRGCVPDQKYVLMKTDAFRETENVSKERKGPPKTVRTPNYKERVYASIQKGM